MIYTVTLNPSIDYVVRLEKLELDAVNRIQEDLKLPGGKGINVSRILNQLGIASTAWGFTGGFTGAYIAEWLRKEGIQTDFTPVAEPTRINVKIKAEQETELNGAGPLITPAARTELEEKFSELAAGDVVVLSGSKPPSLPADYYQHLIRLIQAHGASFVIDTTGAELMASLAARPLVVKPNHHELAELHGITVTAMNDIIPYGKKLVADGARFAIVSMASEGALFFDGEAVYHGWSPKGTVKNSVGSGDSMIAGFVGTYVKEGDALAAFRMSLACGSATAFADDLAQAEAINALLPNITIKKLEEVA